MSSSCLARMDSQTWAPNLLGWPHWITVFLRKNVVVVVAVSGPMSLETSTQVQDPPNTSSRAQSLLHILAVQKGSCFWDRHTAGNLFVHLAGLETKVYLGRTSQVGLWVTMWLRLALQKSSYFSFFSAGLNSVSHNIWLWKHCLISIFWAPLPAF